MAHFQKWGGSWPGYADALHHFAAFAILWLILLYMYRQKSFVSI